MAETLNLFTAIDGYRWLAVNELNWKFTIYLFIHIVSNQESGKKQYSEYTVGISMFWATLHFFVFC